MTDSENKAFHCELIDPAGKLLDCQAASVVLPAHDGQLGILYDHMPMLCQLGLGVMKVTPAPTGQHQEAAPAHGGGAGRSDLFFFIDGGCALVAQNTVTVIAYEARALQGAEAGQLESMIDQATKNAASAALPAGQRAHETERRRVLQRAAESLKN